VATACAALPLVLLGAEVTTKQVGMVDKVGFRAPWHLFSVSLHEMGLGYFIEHGHRLAGFVVGICTIVLALGLTFAARGWFYRSLGWIALLGVGVQGLLGIFRVNLHEILGPNLALLHGCFAQVVFATLVAVAVLTSHSWQKAGGTPQGAAPLRRWAIVLSILVYCQIVFGAVVRHLREPFAQRIHILVAFAVLTLALFVIQEIMRQFFAGTAERKLAHLIAFLLLMQIGLGVEAWLRRFGTATLPELVPSSWALDLARSGHQLVGTILFSSTIALSLFLCRSCKEPATIVPLPSGRMEGAA
jgi:cytochrome c oxidase assembly protein subunit 15